MEGVWGAGDVFNDKVVVPVIGNVDVVVDDVDVDDDVDCSKAIIRDGNDVIVSIRVNAMLMVNVVLILIFIPVVAIVSDSLVCRSINLSFCRFISKVVSN